MNPALERTGLVVQKSVTVAAPLALAFEVFTARIDTWWPMASHHIGEADCQAVVIEPRAGGRWFERGVDGRECDWGRVLAWDPPNHVRLAWQLDARWRFDPALMTEVDVVFTALDREHTRVELTHGGLDAYGEDALAMQATFGSPNGWTGMLEHYAEVAARRG